MDVSNSFTVVFQRYVLSTTALQMFLARSLADIKKVEASADLLKTDLAEPLQHLRAAGKVFKLSIANEDYEPTDVEVGPEEYDFVDNLISLATRLSGFHPQMVQVMSLSHQYALWDALLADTVKLMYLSRPERLKSGKTLTYEEVINFPTRDELLDELAKRRVLEFMYKPLEVQLQGLAKFGMSDPLAPLGSKGFARIVQLRDIRNLIIHNNGRADQSYYEKYGVPIGEEIALDGHTTRQDINLLGKAGVYLVKEAMRVDGLGRPTLPKDAITFDPASPGKKPDGWPDY